ncbi:MAG: hypothetical protein ACYC54_12980 [Sedimentisphaerales bacterium]
MVMHKIPKQARTANLSAKNNPSEHIMPETINAIFIPLANQRVRPARGKPRYIGQRNL